MSSIIKALVLFREFILGSNPLGTVNTLASGRVTVVGGEEPSLLVGPHNVLPGDSAPVIFGSGSATSELLFPSATVEAWSAFFKTAAAETTAAPKKLA